MSSDKRPAGHRCNLCGRVFESAELLEAHKKMEHGEAAHPPAGVG